jgi:ABC-type dipeptide/oligopeptide/nickel transport system ATPase component
MKEGRIVEEATLDAIRSGDIHQAYTRDLLAASRRAHGAITTA